MLIVTRTNRQKIYIYNLHIQVTLEEVNSQIALEYGQAMTVRILKADGEVMRKFLFLFLFL